MSSGEKVKAITSLRVSAEITRFKGLGEISPDEFKHFIGDDIRPRTCNARQSNVHRSITAILHGAVRTQDRQRFIIDRTRKVETWRPCE